MKKILSLIAVILFSASIYAQMPEAINIEPSDATAFDELTLTLDISKTCPAGALIHADSVMIHSGVTIDEAGWQNVIDFNAFGANGQQPKLVRLGPGIPMAITINNATAFEEVTITLDARKSCPEGGLFDADSVMMHSGVNIDGAAWSNVVEFNGLGVNGQQPKLISNGDSTWSITYIPSEFYGIEAGAVVTEINCVFNIGDWSGEGKDFDELGECTDFVIPLGQPDAFKWAITYVPADFYGIEAGANVTAINCVFNAGDWAAGEGKDFDDLGECTDFLIPIGPSGIEDNITIGKYNIYPNPVENELNITNIDDVNKIEIYNVIGEKIKSFENFSKNTIVINTAELTSGIYFVAFHNNAGIQTTKFVKN